jgi:hypothetical protein
VKGSWSLREERVWTVYGRCNVLGAGKRVDYIWGWWDGPAALLSLPGGARGAWRGLGGRAFCLDVLAGYFAAERTALVRWLQYMLAEGGVGGCWASAGAAREPPMEPRATHAMCASSTRSWGSLVQHVRSPGRGPPRVAGGARSPWHASGCGREVVEEQEDRPLYIPGQAQAVAVAVRP